MDVSPVGAATSSLHWLNRQHSIVMPTPIARCPHEEASTPASPKWVFWAPKNAILFKSELLDAQKWPKFASKVAKFAG